MVRGHERALVTLYDRYVDGLYNYGGKFTGKSESIEDAIQDLFTEIWFRREKLCVPDSVKAYLLRAFRQKLLRQLLHYRHISFIDEYLPIGAQDDHQYIHTQVLSETEAERKTSLQRALSTLSQKEQQAITLKYIDNLSHDEIVQVMEIKKQTLYNLLHTAIRKLTLAVKAKHPAKEVFSSAKVLLLLLSLI